MMMTTWNPEEYAAKLPPEQRERWWQLYRTRPEVVRENLTCPDCGAKLVLLQQPPSFPRQLQINALYDHDPDWF